MELVFGVLVIVILYFYYQHTQENVENIRTVAQSQLSVQQDQNQRLVQNLENVIVELNKERTSQEANVSKLVNAVIAKNAAEARDLNLTDKVLPITVGKPETEATPDLVPLDSLSDEDWDKHIQAQLLGGSEPDSVGVVTQ